MSLCWQLAVIEGSQTKRASRDWVRDRERERKIVNKKGWTTSGFVGDFWPAAAYQQQQPQARQEKSRETMQIVIAIKQFALWRHAEKLTKWITHLTEWVREWDWLKRDASVFVLRSKRVESRVVAHSNCITTTRQTETIKQSHQKWCKSS